MNKTAFTALQLEASARDLVPAVNVPFFLIHGADDAITFPSGSQYFFDHASTPAESKRIAIIPNARHEVFH